jgi:uncharacterized protein YndB with AHSA1/START domain
VKLIMIIAGGIITLIVVVLLVGALLPRKHLASREITLRQPPSEVYATLRNFASAPKWRPDLERVELLEDVEGRIRFREDSKNGRITYELLEENPPEKLVTRIVDVDLGYSGTWTYSLSPNEQGTRVRITEEGDVPNVIFRVMSRFVFGHTATMDAYLGALARKFGEEATPR